MPRVTKAKPRRRLEAAAARELILDATEKQLVITGPGGIRLQEVAKEAGVSHPTVLHHFGSREALVRAVCERSIRAIHASLVQAIGASTGEEDQLAAMLDAVSHAVTRSGHARIVMWLALEGHGLSGSAVRLDPVIDATHELRRTRFREKGRRTPPKEDTAYAIVLATLAVLASAVIGPTILENAGLAADDAGQRKFRAWFARALRGHLEGAN